MNLFKDDKGNWSLMRFQSFSCYILFVYLCIWKTSEVSFDILALIGLLAFFPKMIQKFAESKL